MVNILEPKVLAGEIGVKLFDSSALENLSHIDVVAFVEYFALIKCVA